MTISEKKNYVVILEDIAEPVRDLNNIEDNTNKDTLMYLNGSHGRKQATVFKTRVESRADCSRLQALEWMQEDNVLAVMPDIPLAIPETNIKHVSDDDIGFDAGDFVLDSDSSYTGNNVKVALLDSGIVHGHAAFDHGSFSLRDSRNFTCDGSELEFEDKIGHGTYCAGILLGGEVEAHRIGVAPGICDAIVCKVLGNSSGIGALLKGLLWANEKEAEIISMPIEARFTLRLWMALRDLNRENLTAVTAIDPRNLISEYFEEYHSYIEGLNITLNRMRLESRTGAGSLLIAAAGNGSNHYGITPVSLNCDLPARYKEVLGVGCFERAYSEYKIYNGSNFGFDIGAPGDSLRSADIFGNSKALKCLTGTSGSTSYVAGIAALWADKIKREDPNGLLDIGLLKETLLENASTSMIDMRFSTSQYIGNGIAMAP